MIHNHNCHIFLTLALLSVPVLAINSDTLCNAIDVSSAEQAFLTDFKAEVFQVTRSQGTAYDTLTPVSALDWKTYNAKNEAEKKEKGSGPANSSSTPFLKYGSCLESPYVNAYINATAPYVYSLAFKVHGAGTLKFDLKSALDADNWWDTDKCPLDSTAEPLLEYFRDSYNRLVVLVDGEEQFVINSTGFEPMLTDIAIGDDWSTETLNFNSKRYNHSVQFLVLVVPKTCARATDAEGYTLYRDKSTRGAIHTYATNAKTYGDYTDSEFVAKCFNQIWLDNFDWQEEKTDSGSLVDFNPDPRTTGHYSPDPYPFEQDEAATVFISSEYSNLVFFYTLDGSEPQLIPDDTLGFVCGENTFLSDDLDNASLPAELSRAVTKPSDSFGITFDEPVIIRAVACEKVKAANLYGYKYLATDGVVYPKYTQFHYLPATAAPPTVDSENHVNCLSPAVITLYQGTPGSGVKVANLSPGSVLPDLSVYDQAYLQAGVDDNDGFFPGQPFLLPNWPADAFYLEFFSNDDGLAIQTNLTSLPAGTVLLLDGTPVQVGDLVDTPGDHTLTATAPGYVGTFTLTISLIQDNTPTLPAGWHLLPLGITILSPEAIADLTQARALILDEQANCVVLATDKALETAPACWLFAPVDNFPNPLYHHWQLPPTSAPDNPPTNVWQLTPAQLAPTDSTRWSWLDGHYRSQDTAPVLWWFLPR